MANSVSETSKDPEYPRVSFVTPFFNTEKYLEECIESVLRQTYQNWDYILVNNRSTDGSVRIAEKYANQISGKDPRRTQLGIPFTSSELQSRPALYFH